MNESILTELVLQLMHKLFCHSFLLLHFPIFDHQFRFLRFKPLYLLHHAVEHELLADGLGF